MVNLPCAACRRIINVRRFRWTKRERRFLASQLAVENARSTIPELAGITRQDFATSARIGNFRGIFFVFDSPSQSSKGRIDYAKWLTNQIRFKIIFCSKYLQAFNFYATTF
jgi:hypothetical protein